MIRLLALLIALTFFYVTQLIVVHFVFDGYIDKSTEQKYLRNLSRYHPFTDRIFTISFADGRDSLSFFSKVPLSVIDPFHKWYIGDNVGMIPPSSPLSKKLDSLDALWTSKNQYK